jgi:uncharacterized membrane protein (DUF4010 family)
MAELPKTWIALGIALGIGLLIGMQREWSQHASSGGIRTFPLIALVGSLSALLARSFGGWILAAGLVAVAAVLLVGRYVALSRDVERGVGITTEIAALTTYGIGAAVMAGHVAVGIVAGGVTAVLLQWQQPLHRFVTLIGEEEFRAITQFVLVALVVLPLLPDQTYGWYGVLNPFRIWLLVVLIMGISLAGYVIYRFLGERSGAVVSGLLGGLVSSTATTVSYARQYGGQAAASVPTALVITLASVAVYPRIGLEIGAVAPELLRHAAVPLAILFVSLIAPAIVMYRQLEENTHEGIELANPAQLRTAIVFAALYALIILTVAAVQDAFGDDAVFVVALVSGLTDVDAVTLSMAELFRRGEIDPDIAWRATLTATLSNLALKAGVAGLLGGPKLMKPLAAPFGMALAVGLLVVLFWG